MKHPHLLRTISAAAVIAIALISCGRQPLPWYEDTGRLWKDYMAAVEDAKVATAEKMDPDLATIVSPEESPQIEWLERDGRTFVLVGSVMTEEESRYWEDGQADMFLLDDRLPWVSLPYDLTDHLKADVRQTDDHGIEMRVIQMLEEIHKSGDDGSKYIERAKKGETKLMGFGHRLYKTYDPRAKILREAAERVLKIVKLKDPLLDIAQRLEEKARSDSYFIDRNLYPNVDFYSGIILKAIGMPLDMFTVMFAIGRMPGWIAHWREVASNPKGRIIRPRQVYTGPAPRDYIKMRYREGEISADYESDEHKSFGGGASENASARA